MDQKHPIKAWRESENLSRDAAAVRLGVTGMTIYRWERGMAMPQKGDWARIEEETGVTPSELAAFRATTTGAAA